MRCSKQKIPDLYAMLSLFSEPVHRGWLHLQRVAAGRWIHSFPLLTSRTPCDPGIKPFPGATSNPIYPVPTLSEQYDKGECSGKPTTKPCEFQHGLRWSSRNGPRLCGQPSVLNGWVKMNTERWTLFIQLHSKLKDVILDGHHWFLQVMSECGQRGLAFIVLV